MMTELPKVTSSGSIHFHGNYSATDVTRNMEDYGSYQQIPSRSQSRTSRLSRLSSTASSVGQSRHIENWLNQKSLRHLQDKHSLEDFESRQLYTTVLRNEESFVHGINEFLLENDLLNLRRRELLHKEWHENVYVPTRKKVEEVFENKHPLLDLRKREEYEKFLDYKNKKGDVFLDTISKDEYDPLCLMTQEGFTNIKARTGRLLDPLVAQERQRIEEQRAIYRCETGDVLSDDEIRKRWLPPAPLKPLGREGMNCQTWIDMPLKLIESKVHDRSIRKMRGDSNFSTIDFGGLWDTERQQSLPNESTVSENSTPRENLDPNSEKIEEMQPQSVTPRENLNLSCEKIEETPPQPVELTQETKPEQHT